MFDEIRKSISNLNPAEVRDQAERPVRIGLAAQTPQAYSHMAEYFMPAGLSPAKRAEVQQVIQRIDPASGRGSGSYDLEIYDEMLPRPHGSFPFYANHPAYTVGEVLKQRPELALSLARHVHPFRRPYIGQTITKVARENALFSLATALPDIIPSFISLPWAVGEFATDTAFLTMNQIRMAFLIAAASDRPVGYAEQKTEVASLIAGAFGWRALARELVGKIPFGGGLIPKAGIAYAGTYVVGLSLERVHRIGYGYTRRERSAIYDDAFARGKQVASGLLQGMKRMKAPAKLR